VQRRSLEQRVTILEQHMRELRDLPKRMTGVESQILQLRVETHDGFSAIRSELLAVIGAGHSAIRSELLAEIRAGHSAIRSELRAEIQAGNSAIRSELLAVIRAGNSAIRSELLAEIRAGNQESRNFMRALYEDLIARIATIGEKDS